MADAVPAVWRESFKIRFSECDRHRRLKLRSWFDLAQEAAGNHAEALHVGLGMLTAMRRVWVLARMKLEMAQEFVHGETVTVETYPTQRTRLFAARQFVFYDGAGRRRGWASSWWLLLDADSLKPLRLDTALTTALPENRGLPVFFPELDKLPELPEAPDGATLCAPVLESAIDVNGHMNNAEYAARSADFLAAQAGDDVAVTMIQINFLYAVTTGAMLTLRGCSDPGSGDFRIAGQTDNMAVFQAAGKMAVKR